MNSVIKPALAEFNIRKIRFFIIIKYSKSCTNILEAFEAEYLHIY
jgi:hypothetical protein